MNQILHMLALYLGQGWCYSDVIGPLSSAFRTLHCAPTIFIYDLMR
uniref:Uncharacterized protein n=1 Tax=Rhizophora mucronata TaxID=61149 RepID=A0A2P2PRW2_RHIMU